MPATTGFLGALLRRVALALATGYIFVYYSELMFWSRPIEGPLFPSGVGLWLIYSVEAFVFLTLITAFRVRSFAALLLAGALFGWLTEGVVAQTLYFNLPWSVSATGLSWHAIITVVFGWYGAQWLLRCASAWRAALAFALLGLFYGGWAIFWWVNAPPATPLPVFVAYVFGSTLALLVAYRLSGALRIQGFTPSLGERIVVALLILTYFIVVTFPAAPIALIILPPLVSVAALLLWRNRRVEARATLLEQPATQGRLRWPNALALLLAPLVASGVYALALAAQVNTPIVGYVIYAITIPLGFLLFGYAAARILWPHRPAPTAQPTDRNAMAATPNTSPTA